VLIILFVFASINIQAQKNIKKETAFNDQTIDVDLDFASSIEIITWDQPTIQVVAKVKTQDPKYTELFRVELREENHTVFITSNSKDVLQAYQKDQELPDIGVIYTNGLDHEFNYQLMVPKNVKLNISSITGEIISNYVKGNIAVDLVNGNIKIKQFEGDLKLDTVNGRIELPGKDSSVIAKTVIGRIETTEELAFHHKENFIGEEVSLENESSQNSMELNTVNGTIVLN
ncbi:MAG: hypothetical protein ACQEWD_15660, partial [Bacteroidota bacterium]